MGWTEHSAASFLTGAPGRGSQVWQIFQNFAAMATGSAGAPKIQTAAIEDDAVTAAKIAADAVGSSEIAVDAVGQSEVAAGAIHQAELNTSYGEMTAQGTGLEQLVLPGGEYGFLPYFRKSNTGTMNINANIASGFSLPSDVAFVSTLSMQQTTNAILTLYARQRYINSSPPYNLGDGDVPLFHFGLLRGGIVVSSYTAEVPPWAYNGPTSVKADFVDKFGRKFKRRKIVDKGKGRVSSVFQEITHAVKNADMDLIPHPFASMREGDEVILLNPPETQGLLDMHQAGESIAKLLSDDYLRLDNEELNRATPSGVKACRYKWKNTP